MEVVLKASAGVWRSRGKPRTEVPERVFQLLRATYRTGECGSIPLDDDGLLSEEGEQLLSLLRIGARRLEKRLRTQQNGREVLFQMVDRGRRGAAA